MEKHLECKKGAHCWKLTEHLQNLKRSEQMWMCLSLATSTTFICFVWTSHEITAWWARKTSLICAIGIGDDSAPVQGQYDMPAVETSEAGWGGYTRLVFTNTNFQLCTILYLCKVIIQEQILGCFKRTFLPMDIVLIYFVLIWSHMIWFLFVMFLQLAMQLEEERSTSWFWKMTCNDMRLCLWW